MATQALYKKRPGWLTFSAVVLFAVAVLRFISAISYFSSSRKVNDLSTGLFGDQLWGWGLWDLCIAALAFFGALSLLRGETFGRLVAYVWAIVIMIESFLIISVAPWYAASTIALTVLVIYGLSTTADWSDTGRPR